MRGGVLSEEFQGIIKRLIDNDRTLTTLDINGNQIGSEGAKAIAEALEKNTTLKILNISDNKIGYKGVQYLAVALEYNTTLTTFDISYNNIGDIGVQYLAKALEYNTTLTTFDISRNLNISIKGVKALAEALTKNKKSALTTLNIEVINLDNIGSKVLIKALKDNKHLTTLNINYNNIGDSGTNALAELLETNTTLKTINIIGTNISLEGAQKLAQSLHTNKKSILTTLDISDNNIGNKMKQYIKTLIGINIDKFYQESAIVMNSKQTTSQSAVLSVLPIDVWIIIFQKLGIIGTQTFMNAVTT